MKRKQLRLSYPNISFEELSFGYIECTNDGCEHYRHKLTDLFYAWNIHDEEWHIDSQEFVNAFNKWSIDSKEYTHARNQYLANKDDTHKMETTRTLAMMAYQHLRRKGIYKTEFKPEENMSWAYKTVKST
jgi:hypothetical protein